MAKGCGHCVCIKGYEIYICGLRGVIMGDEQQSSPMHPLLGYKFFFFVALMSIKGYEKIIVAQKVYEWATTL